MNNVKEKSKKQQVEELKTKIRGGHKSGYQPALERWEKELLEEYKIKTTWIKKRDSKYCPYWKPEFKKVKKKRKTKKKV